MAWLCKNDISYRYYGVEGWKYETEVIFRFKPRRSEDKRWMSDEEGIGCPLPDGSIRKLTGKDITWNDEPIRI